MRAGDRKTIKFNSPSPSSEFPETVDGVRRTRRTSLQDTATGKISRLNFPVSSFRLITGNSDSFRTLNRVKQKKNDSEGALKSRTNFLCNTCSIRRCRFALFSPPTTQDGREVQIRGDRSGMFCLQCLTPNPMVTFFDLHFFLFIKLLGNTDYIITSGMGKDTHTVEPAHRCTFGFRVTASLLLQCVVPRNWPRSPMRPMPSVAE